MVAIRLQLCSEFVILHQSHTNFHFTGLALHQSRICLQEHQLLGELLPELEALSHEAVSSSSLQEKSKWASLL